MSSSPSLATHWLCDLERVHLSKAQFLTYQIDVITELYHNNVVKIKRRCVDYTCVDYMAGM